MSITTIAAAGTQPSQTEGGIEKLVVSDDNTQHLLNDTIKELKKMNLQMSIMTDTEVTNREVE